MVKKNLIFLILALGAVASSCSVDDSAQVSLVKLGAATKEYLVEPEGTTLEIPVYSNNPYHIELIGESLDWLTIKEPSEKCENGYISAECSFNREFKRRADIVLCSEKDSRRDTVTIKQKGLIEANLSMDNLSVVLAGCGGDNESFVRTNIPFSYMNLDVTYSNPDDAGWIKDIKIQDSEIEKRSLLIQAEPNPSETVPRTATLMFSFTDGWGEKVQLKVNAVQRTSTEQIGIPVSMEDLKSDYPSGVIADYILVEGIVVSNTEAGNAGENEQQTTSNIDYTGCRRTLYLEALDGSTGICLQTTTADETLPALYSKVQILLYGTTGTLKLDPERYDITGLTSSMITSQTPGTKSDVPVKKKTIGTLDDTDIYTYVTVTGVEFAIRKGPLFPVNEGYTNATNAHRLSKLPLLFRDAEGKSMYILTNTTCLYRRDGTAIPQGCGNLSGVLVHERFPRYNWRNLADPAEMDDDPTLGRIGTYQLRHQTKEDIWGEMSDDVEQSFSKILCEYRYWYPDKVRGVCLPTYGTNGWLTHTYQQKYTGSAQLDFTEDTFGQHMKPNCSPDYLGPVGNNAAYVFGLNTNNINGIGMKLNLSKERFHPDLADLYDMVNGEWCGPDASSVYANRESNLAINYNATLSNPTNQNMRGKGCVPDGCYTGFHANHWWNYSTGRGYGWLINFSTLGISASHLAMQFSVQNTSQNFYAPRFWKAEWAYTDSQEPSADKQWHLIDEYLVPDISVWSNTLYSSLVSQKQIDMPLPLEILGHENVYIRLVPTSDAVSNGFDYSDAYYGDAPLDANGETSHYSALGYFAIRYN
ncbi:MAG: hypothetical protein MJY62_02325 [Bacteroidales bacterium]|nr:hypothetical protein [Bacteroidales bacterium]